MNNLRLEIKKSGINGEGIAYFQRKPVFIDDCFPGEIVECTIENKGRYFKGKLIKTIKRSNDRIQSICRHDRQCGACVWMRLNYKKQLQIKKELLQEALNKYASYNRQIDDVVPSSNIYHYRNKFNLPVVEYNGQLVNALYQAGSNKPVVIDECVIHDKKLEDIRKHVLNVLNRHKYKAYKQKYKKGIRQLIIRGFYDEYQLVIITGNDIIDQTTLDDLKTIPELVSVYQGINTVKSPLNYLSGDLELLYGKDKIMMQLGKYRMNLSAKAFFQLNYSQALNIYNKVYDLLGDDCQNVIEAYCGIGAISLFISDKVKNVIGIEIVEEAIEDAKKNLKINNIDNVEFICDDATKAIRQLVNNKTIDALIVDPPRTGLDDKLLNTIIQSKINNIIYVSCNPATLAKDLSKLFQKYDIEYLQAYDMFPNTAHVETVVMLYQKHRQFN